MPTYSYRQCYGSLLLIFMVCYLEVATAVISLADVQEQDNNAEFDHAVLTNTLLSTFKRKTSNVIQETDSNESRISLDEHGAARTIQQQDGSAQKSTDNHVDHGAKKTQTVLAIATMTVAKDDGQSEVQNKAPATHRTDLPFFKHRLYPAELNTWMGESYDFDAGYECDKPSSQEIPDDEALWPLLQGIYRGIVGPEASSLGTSSVFGDGFAVDVRVNHAGNGRGRGVFTGQHTERDQDMELRYGRSLSRGLAISKLSPRAVL